MLRKLAVAQVASKQGNEDALHLLDMPGHVIRRLQQHSAHVFQNRIQAEGLDLTPVQFAAMTALIDNPGIDQAQVSTLIRYDRATIGGVIDRLEQKGFVRRVVSRRDRRAREVSLTAAGQAMVDRILPFVASFQPDILSGLTAKEQAQFLKLARKVLAGNA